MISAEPARLLRLATYASVSTAVLLLGVKLMAWLMTGSVSVLASLVDSLMDAVASMINLLAVRYSLMPPDAEHRFGHGKAENLAGLGQATFIAGSAVFLILQVVDRLLHPQPMTDVSVAIGIMLFAIVATLVLLSIQHRVIKATGSTAIRADALHYASDLLTNGSVIAALVLSGLGWPMLDPMFAIGIAGYILYSAWRIGYEAVQLLLDRELPDEDQGRIQSIALKPGGVRGIHDLRTRRSGQTHIIQLHLDLDGDMSLAEAHSVADQVDSLIKQAFPGADVTIHEDPIPHVSSTTKTESRP